MNVISARETPIFLNASPPVGENRAFWKAKGWASDSVRRLHEKWVLWLEIHGKTIGKTHGKTHGKMVIYMEHHHF